MKIRIDKDLEEIFPIFLQHRFDDVRTLEICLVEKDFLKIQKIGHKMAGTCESYGVGELGILGMSLEEGAEKKDFQSLELTLNEIKTYLFQLEFEYI